jgi:hypothetical protein
MIKMNTGNTNEITILIFNSSGIPVMFQKLILNHEDAAFTISGTERLPEGNYTVTIAWKSGKKITSRLIKHTY